MLDLLKIRRAEPEDAIELAALGYVAWETGIMPLFRENAGMREQEQRRITSYTRECYRRIVIAELDGEAVGWCSHARERPYVPYLLVAPHCQGRGIGSSLLRRVESLLELRGFDRVYLETPADHLRAVRFYEHQGYGILAMKADGHGHYEPLMSVRLEKRLNPYQGIIDDV